MRSSAGEAASILVHSVPVRNKLSAYGRNRAKPRKLAPLRTLPRLKTSLPLPTPREKRRCVEVTFSQKKASDGCGLSRDAHPASALMRRNPSTPHSFPVQVFFPVPGCARAGVYSPLHGTNSARPPVRAPRFEGAGPKGLSPRCRRCRRRLRRRGNSVAVRTSCRKQCLYLVGPLSIAGRGNGTNTNCCEQFNHPSTTVGYYVPPVCINVKNFSFTFRLCICSCDVVPVSMQCS